ncbi:conserved hypothetical protein [uncultured Alphaproteobacteria bacterium]|uniref:Response regulatory domain-containing protein n=1 Tax=uncultured Alphaproteobacteria bacterium TaxID=91750 RepID=A0A212JLI4_9PROT|nr:conserved hypothetical protein [uncultured Alphaproteobacteria bacterium]
MTPLPPAPLHAASAHGPRGTGGGAPHIGDVPALRRRAPVLVVEDEALIAMDLADQIEADGGVVLGPAATSEAALALLAAAPEIGAAVLDVVLGRDTAFAVAAALTRRGIPFVFYTGYDDLRAPPEFAAAPVLDKTHGWREIKRALRRERRSLRTEVEALLPELRVIAREIAGDAETGDRLIERTLARAADEVASRRHYPSVDAWLRHMMKHLAFGRDPGVN